MTSWLFLSLDLAFLKHYLQHHQAKWWMTVRAEGSTVCSQSGELHVRVDTSVSIYFIPCQCSICALRAWPVSLWCTSAWPALEVTSLQQARRAEHFQNLGRIWELPELLTGLRGCYARKERGNICLSCRLQVFQNDLAISCMQSQPRIRCQG